MFVGKLGQRLKKFIGTTRFQTKLSILVKTLTGFSLNFFQENAKLKTI